MARIPLAIMKHMACSWRRSFLLYSVILVGFFFNFTTAQASDGLVGYWKFDEGSGTVANDSSEDNDGTIINGITYSSAEKPPIDAYNLSSLFFDDIAGGGIQVPDDSSFDMTTAMTAVAWVYWDGTLEAKGIISKADQVGGSTPNYQFGVSNTGNLNFWNGTFYVESTSAL